MARDGSLHCELEKSKDKDENGNQVTTIKCQGDLVSMAAPIIASPRSARERACLGGTERGRRPTPLSRSP